VGAILRSRPSLFGSRSTSSLRRETQPSKCSGQPRRSQSCRRLRRTQLAPAWSGAYRDRSAMLPACRFSEPTLPASGSRFCARLSRVSAGWRSWPTLAFPTPCRKWTKFKPQPTPSALQPPNSKSGEPKTLLPPFEVLKSGADALYVCSDALINANRIRINTLALAARLPTMHGVREFVEAGGLMSYGPDYPDLFRRTADFVDKILRGAKPSDLPVEQPTKFDLVINLTTAKALGLEVSDAARAC
jgi:ABC transporter substrate binding protein